MFTKTTLGALLLAGATSAIAAARPAPELGLKDNEHKRLGEKITDYFEAMDASRGINEAFVELAKWSDKTKKRKKGMDPLALVEDWERGFYYARLGGIKYKPKKGSVQGTKLQWRGDVEIDVTFHAPAKYSPKKGPYPLLITVHDEGQDPAAHLDADWAEAAGRDGVILAAVHMPADASVWTELGSPNEPAGVFAVMNTYGVILEHFVVDMDRVYLAGNGKGTGAAAATAAAFPHLFAGLIGRGATPEIDAANLRNLPTLFLGGGEGATAFEAKAKELGYENTTVSDGGEGEAWAWIGENQRDPYPAHLTFSPPTPYTLSAHWLRVDGVDIEANPTVDAVVDSAANTITVTADQVSTVQIFFNDALVDLSNPVKVVVNGVEHEQLLSRNQRTMLDLAFKWGDWGRVFTAVYSYDVTAKDKE